MSEGFVWRQDVDVNVDDGVQETFEIWSLRDWFFGLGDSQSSAFLNLHLYLADSSNDVRTDLCARK